MGYNKNFSKACLTRDISTSKLISYLEQLMGKPEEEQQSLMEKFAMEITETCPVLEKKFSHQVEKPQMQTSTRL